MTLIPIYISPLYGIPLYLLKKKSVMVIGNSLRWIESVHFISYCFLEDDVVLFGQGDLSTINAIKWVLDSFYASFGQVISKAKSRSYASPTLLLASSNLISSLLSIQYTSSFGRYLDFLFVTVLSECLVSSSF